MKRRFRASIYVDVFIEESDNETLEQSREKAEEQVRAIVAVLSSPEDVGYHSDLKDLNYSNPYTGGVAHYTPENLLKPLDREI